MWVFLFLCSDINLHSDYYMYNPLTRIWLPPPHPPAIPVEVLFLGVHIGFIFQGQGISFKYAVVRFPCNPENDGGDPVKFSIFTSDSGI